MANNLTIEDINNLYFWATKLEESITYGEIESKEDILNLTYIEARNSLPKEVFKLNRLECLNIWVEDLTELPKEIGNLNNLKKLEIECPNLNELPKEIGNLTNLGASSRVSSFRHCVEIDCHNLNELPKEIRNLTNLLLLIISSHNLKELPKDIGNLTNLGRLTIECPNLNELPKEIGNLNGRLKICCRNLKELPKEIWNLSDFDVEFYIKNNNNKELLKYIVDSPNNENKDVELKINIKRKEAQKMAYIINIGYLILVFIIPFV